MPLPTCTVNGASTSGGVDVADDGGVVTIQLTDLSADTWAISIIGTDDAVIKPTLTVNSTTKTATFTKPAGPWAMIFQSQVNGGVDINGAAQSSYTTTFGIYIKTASKGLRLVAVNERGEGSATFGWTKQVNAAIKTADAGGGGGSGAIAWQRSSGTTIVIPASATPQGASYHGLVAPGAVTLPAAPTAGQDVYINDEDGTGVSQGVVVSGNGHNIVAPDGTSAATFTFSTAAWGYAARSKVRINWNDLLGAWQVWA